MQVYQTDHEGFYIGTNNADPDPLQAGNWLIPGGCVTAEPPALTEGQRAQWTGSAWTVVDPVPEPEPDPEPEPTPEELLSAERQTMVCSPLQGQLALGETKWTEVEAIMDDPETPWAMRVTIDKANEWKRLSQSIDQLAWLVGLDEFQTDDLFRAAMQIEV